MATNKKPKILIFSTAYYPFVGGAEVAVKEITDNLGRTFQFDLITAKLQKDLPSVETIGKVTVYRIGFGIPTLDKLLVPFLGAWQAAKLNRVHHYSCYWAVMATFASGAGYIYNICRILTRQKRIPIVLTLQEGDSESHLKYRWAGLIALSWWLALKNSDFLTTISNFLLNRAKKNGYTGESALVPNGVDISLFSKEVSEKTKKELRERLLKKPGDVFLVTSGRLTHKNAVDDIISSLVYLPKNIILIVIGKGDLGPKLQKQAKDLGVLERVKFLGFLPYDEIPKYLSICDIFIRPSRSEGFGNSFIEAMASGVPVIATPIGGIPDFIDDKETGLFCSSDNPKSIAEAVKLFINDPVLKSHIINQAKDRVRERYNWDYISTKMQKVFEIVISNPT